MKRAWLTFLTIALAAGLGGCCGPHGQGCTSWLCGSCANSPETCASCTAGCDTCGGVGCDTCGEVGCETCGDPYAQGESQIGADQVYCDACDGRGCRLCRRRAFTPGPPTGAITYPYYTHRGPRDFLAQNPRSIGP